MNNKHQVIHILDDRVIKVKLILDQFATVGIVDPQNGKTQIPTRKRWILADDQPPNVVTLQWKYIVQTLDKEI